jgi:hypothetical protein
MEELENLNKFELQDKIKELELNKKDADEATKDIDASIAFQGRKNERSTELFDSKVEQMNKDFNQRISDAEEQNKLNQQNAQKIAALT